MHSRQPELYCAALIPYTAAGVALVLRLVSRSKTGVRPVWEDYVSVLAFIVGTGFTFISVFKMRWGLGRPVSQIDLPSKDIEHHFFRDLWTDMWLYTFSVGLSKFVILGFYWRTFGRSTIRLPIIILGGLSLLWIILRVSIILSMCQPIHKFWDKSTPGKCPISPNISLFGAHIPHLLIEVGILACPMVEIYKLHLPRAKKIAVAVMFTSGVLVCGSALGTIIHTVTMDPKSADLTWDGIDDQIWAVCDVNIAHFATSLPLLRPAFQSFGQLFSSVPFTASSSCDTSRRSKFFNRQLSQSYHDLEDGSARKLVIGKRSEGEVVQNLSKFGSTEVIELNENGINIISPHQEKGKDRT